MRYVRFAGLQRIAHLVAEHPDGIRAGELNQEILAKDIYRTERGSPAKSTLYHCRNTLINLGIVERRKLILSVAFGNPIVRRLLDAPLPEKDSLSPLAREALADLVLRNPDCFRHFFHLFVSGNAPVSLERFRATAKPVVWVQATDSHTTRTIQLRSVAREQTALLDSPVAIRSILYGVRYWARDDLQIIDEFFETGRGSVMYPVRTNASLQDAGALMCQILDLPAATGDWTTVSVNAMLRLFCEQQGYQVSTLFDAIRIMIATYPAHVALIPTIPNFAAISATSHNRETFELQGYFTDAHGRLISHIRFHNTLRGMKHAKSTPPGQVG
jgi:hypothetical protein